ncbi:Zn-ribbon domain-containing OB-fold protein [Mycolicibacterium vinylchloridicum]|uniref:Zn-ribbon domain-containing OB-fold protein n=1 Tax=Mycolicibacterium vinylchloridicum TaxID=2736928 RepID=UPI002D7FC165|nr:OB-fold domain-containing protein [Mycolicibacterium vinylchloridicum]
MSGRGTLHSYVISHRAAPGFGGDVPYAIALVQLDEGPKMMSNILGIENVPENLVLDMPLEVTFEQRGDVAVPQFQPAGTP